MKNGEMENTEKKTFSAILSIETTKKDVSKKIFFCASIHCAGLTKKNIWTSKSVQNDRKGPLTSREKCVTLFLVKNKAKRVSQY